MVKIKGKLLPGRNKCKWKYTFKVKQNKTKQKKKNPGKQCSKVVRQVKFCVMYGLRTGALDPGNKRLECRKSIGELI